MNKKWLSVLLGFPFSFIYYLKNIEDYEGWDPFIHGFLSGVAMMIYVQIIMKLFL